MKHSDKNSTYENWTMGLYTFPSGFQLAIFQAYRIADEGNRDRLEHAFPYWFDPTWEAPKEKETHTMYEGKKVEVVDMTPSWDACSMIYMDALESQDERRILSARQGVKQMAKAADLARKVIPFLKKYNYKDHE